MLDGSLGKTELNSYTKNDRVENLSDGIINNAPVDGAGKNDQYSLDFKGSFGAGDSISYTASFTDPTTHTQVTKNIKLEYDASAVNADPAQAAKDGKFAGGTKEEQMESIAAALKEVTVDGTPGGAKLFAEYDINVESYDVKDASGNIVKDEHGNAVKDYKINLKASAEGVSNVQLSTDSSGIALVDKSIIANARVSTNGADAGTAAIAPPSATAAGLDDLLNNVAELQLGDVVKLKANVQGKDMTVTLKVGETADNVNGVFKLGSDIKETTENLVAALNAASFDDDSATGIDESQFKVSEYFDVKANTKADGTTGTTATEGSIQILNKTGDGVMADANTLGRDASGTGFTITRNGAVSKAVDASAATGGTAATGSAAVNQVSTLTFTNSFMDKDSVTIRGNLSDGRSFETTLVAGKDFAIGADNDATLANIVTALNSGTDVNGEDVNLKVAQSDGTVKDVKSSLIFGTAADGKDFEVTAGAAGSNQISIKSNVAGIARKGVAGAISSASTTIDEKNKVSDVTVKQDVVGKGQTTALNTITFDPSKIEQGTKLTVDGKTYEFVSNADFLTNENNTAVIIENLNKRDADGNLASDAATGEDIAKAVINALHNGTGTHPGIGGAPGVPSAIPGGNANAYIGTYTAQDGQIYNLSVDPNSSSLKIETQTTGTNATALTDIEVSSGNQNTSVIKFNTETTGAGSAQKTTANVKVGDTITVDGKTYEFTDGEHRTKTEGNVEVKLNVKDGYTAEEAAKALADAINTNTKDDIADGKPGGVIASVGTVENKDGSRSFVVNLASKYNDTKGTGHEYDAPVVDIPTSGKGLTLQIGETSEDYQKVNVAIDRMDSEALGIGDINVGGPGTEGAAAAIDKIKAAINTVSSTRGDLGALQNRLEHTINNLGVTTENMTAAESRIRDTDMAKEMMEFTKNNILVQASQAMLAQANQLPQGVLQLLQ